jgi:hypothetical protein
MDFWDLMLTLLIWIPLIMIWTFALIDIFRRDDMKGWLKALWVVIIIFIPLFGTLIYLLFRRPGATPEERQAMDEASREFVQKYSTNLSPAEQLQQLSDLHDKGKITDEEFAKGKAKIIG